MSISSFLISKVNIWRNPLGAEENWLKDLNRDKRFPSSGKMRIANSLYAGIIIVAIVETVALKLFLLLAKSIAFFNISLPIDFAVRNLKSSKFAIEWAIALLCGANSQNANLCTHENSAKECAPSTFKATDEMQGKGKWVR